MLAKRIIPCLDVKDGRVVKGVNFVDLRDAGDPVERALAYAEAGGLLVVVTGAVSTEIAFPCESVPGSTWKDRFW